MFVEWVVKRFYAELYPQLSILEAHENYLYQMWYLLRNCSLQPSECLVLDTDERIELFMAEKASRRNGNDNEIS